MLPDWSGYLCLNTQYTANRKVFPSNLNPWRRVFSRDHTRKRINLASFCIEMMHLAFVGQWSQDASCLTACSTIQSTLQSFYPSWRIKACGHFTLRKSEGRSEWRPCQGKMLLPSVWNLDSKWLSSCTVKPRYNLSLGTKENGSLCPWFTVTRVRNNRFDKTGTLEMVHYIHGSL